MKSRWNTDYNSDTLERALVHHQLGGRIRSYRRGAVDDRQRWFVQLNNNREEVFTNDQCLALCYGLASAEHADPSRAVL